MFANELRDQSRCTRTRTSEYTHSLMSDSKRKQTSVRVCVCVCVQLTASIAAKWKKNEANLWVAPQASTGSTGYAYSIRCEWSECACVRGDSLSMCIIALYCVVCVFIYLCRRREGAGGGGLWGSVSWLLSTSGDLIVSCMHELN